MKKLTLIGLVTFLIIVGFYIGGISKEKDIIGTPPPKNGIINSVVFTCKEEKTIQAIFFEDKKVKLIMSDANATSLPQVMSASGARYANTDESFVFWNKGDTAFITEGTTTTFEGCVTKNDITKTPAENNCLQLDGGRLVKDIRGDGKEYTLCYLRDARACELETLYKGDCPYGAFKTTGYDTIDQKYCAWLGGRTLAVENSVCTFKDGSTCKTIDLYNGKCLVSGR